MSPEFSLTATFAWCFLAKWIFHAGQQIWDESIADQCCWSIDEWSGIGLKGSDANDCHVFELLLDHNPRGPYCFEDPLYGKEKKCLGLQFFPLISSLQRLTSILSGICSGWVRSRAVSHLHGIDVSDGGMDSLPRVCSLSVFILHLTW